MKSSARWTLAALALATASAPGNAAPPSDWSRVDTVDITAFYPGVSPMEWILGDLRVDRVRHGGGRAFKQGDACVDCHREETADMGQIIASGEKLEPDPVSGRPASIPVKIQAAHDGEMLYLRFSWKQPAAAGTPKLDAAHPIKIAYMLDGGSVEMGGQAGCWAACHTDSKTMPDGNADRSKYLKDGSLADGRFLDLTLWRSGDGKTFDGYVADRRVLEPSTTVVAEGRLEGDTWVVMFKRPLAGGEGDVSLQSGKVYTFGFAIHNEHASGRYHHVSLGYKFGIDAAADITANKF
jgi:hypothetical protein